MRRKNIPPRYANSTSQRQPVTLTGFTLIELLVVIAIIGILASIALGALSDARTKGADAAIVSTINNMRGQAELYYDDNGFTYSGMCDDGNIQDALTAAANQGSGAVTCVDGDDVPRAWAIEAQLVASTSQYFCIDYNGTGERLIGSSISNVGGSADAICGS